MTSVHPGTSETLQNYRGVIVEHFATEAGISASKQRTFTCTKQTHGGKVTEWTPTSFQADMAGLTSDRSNRQGINGKLVFEPLISTHGFCSGDQAGHFVEEGLATANHVYPR